MFRPLPVAALALCAAGSAAAQQAIPFSGYELFPGINSDELIAGVIFVGWTTPDAAIWYPPSAQTGGFWAASVNRVGAAGIGDQGLSKAVDGLPSCRTARASSERPPAMSAQETVP